MKHLLISLSIIIFTACAQPSITKKEVSFENKKWKLVSFGMKRMAVPKEAWITFKEGHYSGNAGCNGMGGQYSVKGNTLKLKAGMSTLMACPEMALETKFHQEIGKVTSYTIKNEQLILMNNDHAVLNFMEISTE